ncbi:calcyclin-binding protein [Anolis carolinensis]|uniref:Calcyclin-binding protein n=1 Tax=Anolis carolinensis TaxID=28377 RepID=G1KQM7_ANOCA|nr:PREDICTED: calcyclin-binding protein [Anolis carolinensis]|eukprot:XP_003219914.2 PREDICTED: calcyclin-binding protein [Anolis carolinensis]
MPENEREIPRETEETTRPPFGFPNTNPEIRRPTCSLTAQLVASGQSAFPIGWEGRRTVTSSATAREAGARAARGGAERPASALYSAAVLEMEELQKDLEEVKELLQKASRKRLNDVLLSEKIKIEKEIKSRSQVKPKVDASEEKLLLTGYTVKINNYAWDQSDKFVKIYITLNGVQHLPAENVQVCFTESSFDLLVKNLNNNNYTMTFNNLLKPISVENSSRKVKTDMIVILCKKKKEEKWECLTQVEKETKEKEKASYDTSDPSEGLMNLLKKMYADGDDEMKRSINKAWVESREKQAKDEMPIDI